MKFTKPSIKNLLKKFTQDTEANVPCFNKDSGPSPTKNGSTGNSRENERPCRDFRTDSNQNSNGAQGRAPDCRGDDSNKDLGNAPYAFDIAGATASNDTYRTALWTGKHLQLTVMSIPVGEETGIERHEGIDQLVGVISGAGEVLFGNRENYFADPIPLDAHSVILIPAGTYHNVKNVGRTPLKLYSVYAPKSHKFGAVDKIKPQ